VVNNTLTHWQSMAKPQRSGLATSRLCTCRRLPGLLINGRIARLLPVFGPLAVLRDPMRGEWFLPARELCRWNLQTPAAIGPGFGSQSPGTPGRPSMPRRRYKETQVCNAERTVFAS